MPSSLPSKILMIHAGGIGDLLLSLPAMRAFRNAFPDFSLELLGFPERLSLVVHDLRASDVHFIDQAGLAQFYLEEPALPPRLVDFFSSFSAALLIGRSQAEIFAENLRRAGLKRVIFLPSFPEEEKKIHVTDALLQTLRFWGIEGDGSFSPLRLSREVLRGADEWLDRTGWKKGGRILAIHPGSGNPVKNWAPSNFARIADWAGEHASVLLISGPARDGREEVLRAVKKARPILLDLLPLPHLAAVLGKCAVFLGNDSGITHLSARMGIPTAALFGPTDPAVWGPRGPQVRIITGGRTCTSCSSRASEGCGRLCLDEITPEVVIKKLAPVLKSGASLLGD